jgi:hypothetical protein
MNIKTAKLVKDKLLNKNVSITIMTTEDVQVCVPFADDNTDYQLYLEWCKTNTPEAAD